MKELLIAKTYELCKQVLSAKYPKQVEIFDMIWPQAKKVLNEVEDGQWPVGETARERLLGLGFENPEIFKSRIQDLLFLFPPLLSELYTCDMPDVSKVRQNIADLLDKYGRMHSTPVSLMKYLRKDLAEFFIKMPDDLEGTVNCRQILPGGVTRTITLKEAMMLPRKTDEYFIFANMLDPKDPEIYIDGEPKKLGIASGVFVSLLKQDGKVCRHGDIVRSAWHKMIKTFPKDIQENYVDRVEKAVETLRKISPLLKENIVTVWGEGYRVTEELLKYCIVEKLVLE